MTVYVANREIDLLGAHIDADEETAKVWFAYSNAADRDYLRGVDTAHVGELTADGGTDEVVDTLADLPDARIRGDHQLAKKARGEAAADDE